MFAGTAARPDDFHEALLNWFPRKVTMPPGEWQTVVPTLHAFVDFLFAEDLADLHCAEPDYLHAALDELTGDFDIAMNDQSRYGLTKFWAVRILAARVDPVGPSAAERYIADVRAGRIAVDHKLLDQVMTNHLAADDERPPPLPVVAIPNDATLATFAAGSGAVARIQQFAQWAAPGRMLTVTAHAIDDIGKVKMTDQALLTDLIPAAWPPPDTGPALRERRGVDHLADLVKHRLRACQQRTDLLAGFFASTGMTLDPEPP